MKILHAAKGTNGLIISEMKYKERISTSREPTTMHLQASYQLLIDQQSEGSASQSAQTMAAPTPTGPGTASNSE